MESDQFGPELRVLLELKSKGFEPSVVYDVGASTGIWSDAIASVLPHAEFHLFEPLADHIQFYRTQFQARQQRLAGLHLHGVALGDTNGTAGMSVFHDGYGSSVHDVHESSEFKESVPVPLRRLDDYIAEQGLPAPDVIKVDCQGSEDAVLRGAEKALKNAKIVIAETWFYRCYGPKNPLITEVVDWMRNAGFALVELGERFYDAKHRLTSLDAFFFSESLLENVWLSPEAPVQQLTDRLVEMTGERSDEPIYARNAALRERLGVMMKACPRNPPRA